MDSPSTPSIMGSENPRFTERREGRSESDSLEFNANSDGVSPSMVARKSKDGLSREERMKLVRERQMEEHKRRLDELRQAQIHAMKAKQQLDDERRRRLEDIKSKEEQRRSAVEARRRRIEDMERARREAILRKHQEIFEKIDMKRRHHESRKMAFGTSTYRLSDQDSIYSNPPSRRAISANPLTSRRGNTTQRAHHQSHVFSPVMAQSARLHPSPSTPSRNGGPLESVSGNSSENSPVHSGRQVHGKHFRATQSHPPPTTRNRQPETARSRQGSRPTTGRTSDDGSKTERARRPTSLMTRQPIDPENDKSPSKKPGDTFKRDSKRSQSVNNVSARYKAKEVEKIRVAVSIRDMSNGSPAHGEVTEIEVRRTPEPENGRPGRKVISEAEAKAALAEKRRLARLKAEAERNRPTEDSNFTEPSLASGESQPSFMGIETPLMTESDVQLGKKERSQSIVTFEKDEAMMERMRSIEHIDESDQSVTFVRESVQLELETKTIVSDAGVEEIIKEPAEIEPDAEKGVITRSASSSDNEEDSLTADVGLGATVIETAPPIRPDVIPIQKVEVDSTSPDSEREEEKLAAAVSEPTKTFVLEDTPSQPVLINEIDKLREETERRRLEVEQREEEARNMRRQRLDAIKRMTGKSNTTTPSAAPAAGPIDVARLASPVVESRPFDALENARKLLQRKGLGGSMDSPSMTNSPSNGALKGFGEEENGAIQKNGEIDKDKDNSDMKIVSGMSFTEETDVVNGVNGHHDGKLHNGSVTVHTEEIHESESSFDPFGNGSWNDSSVDTVSSVAWAASTKHMTFAADTDSLLNFD